MASFYYYDQNPSGYCFLTQIKAFVHKTWILVLVVKRRHRANGPFHLSKDEVKMKTDNGKISM